MKVTDEHSVHPFASIFNCPLDVTVIADPEKFQFESKPFPIFKIPDTSNGAFKITLVAVNCEFTPPNCTEPETKAWVAVSVKEVLPVSIIELERVI